VVGRQDTDCRIRIVRLSHPHPQRAGGRGVASHGLTDNIAGGQIFARGGDGLNQILVGDDQNILGRYQLPRPGQRLGQ